MFEISVIGLGFVGLPLLVSITRQKKYFKNIIGIEANNFSGNKKSNIFRTLRVIVYFLTIN